MSERDMRTLIYQITQREPALVFDIIDMTAEGGAPQQGQGGPSPAPSWCVCGKCREMPTVEERVCCRATPDLCLSISAVSESIHIIFKEQYFHCCGLIQILLTLNLALIFILL